MSVRRFLTFVSLFIAVAACHRQEGTKAAGATSKTGAVAGKEADLRSAKVKQTVTLAAIEQNTDSRLGNHANPDGVVVQEFNEFKSGEPIILSMTVKQSPRGLQMRAEWKDSAGKVIAEERKDMNGGKTAAFTYSGKKLKPGDYSVTGYWGGNVAAEKKFKVTK